MRSGNGRHRRPRQAPAIVVAAGVTGSAMALPLLATGSASAADAATWDRVAECESGGQWSANFGNGMYGGLQFTQDSWERNGGLAYAPSPDLASRGQQIAVAEKALAKGSTEWATCAPIMRPDERRHVARRGPRPHEHPQGPHGAGRRVEPDLGASGGLDGLHRLRRGHEEGHGDGLADRSRHARRVRHARLADRSRHVDHPGEPSRVDRPRRRDRAHHPGHARCIGHPGCSGDAHHARRAGGRRVADHSRKREAPGRRRPGGKRQLGQFGRIRSTRLI